MLPADTPAVTRQPVKVINPRSTLDAAEDGRALSTAEAVQLLELHKEEDLARLRQVANTVRQRQCAETVQYATETSLFLTNVCEMAPTLYPFPRQLGEKGAYTLTIDDIDATLELARSRGTQQLTLSGGGFHSGLSIPGMEAMTPLKTFTHLLTYIREKAPALTVRGFSPDEIDFLCILRNRNERYIMELLVDHGLKALGSFGSEILVDTARMQISPKKVTVKRWLAMAAMAKKLNLPMTACIEAGPMETLAQRVSHWEALRQFLKKHPGTFSAFYTQMWPKAPAQAMPSPGISLTNHSHRLKLIAVARLFLGETIPDQQVCWLPDHEEEAQEALGWGANHFGGTDALAYHRFLSGQRKTAAFTETEFKSLIVSAGHQPATP